MKIESPQKQQQPYKLSVIELINTYHELCLCLPEPYSLDPEQNLPSYRARKIWQSLGALDILKLFQM